MKPAFKTIGTRGSPLALAQAHEVQARLAQAHDVPVSDIAIEVISTSGDRIQDKALREFGGKGLFTKEIEEALLDGRIDLAVHSMKDMPTVLPDGLEITCILPREDVRDAFVSPRAGSLHELPEGAVLGTSSLRRQAQILALRPDLKVITFRGNVQTRLKKLADGVADATLLASAGLRRLNMADTITALIEPDVMLPAVAQGAIGIEIRQQDEDMRRLLVPLNHEPTRLCVATERAFLARLDGSCQTPIAGLAQITGQITGETSDGTIRFRGMVLRPDGSESFNTEHSGPVTHYHEIGEAAGNDLLSRIGPDFFA